MKRITKPGVIKRIFTEASEDEMAIIRALTEQKYDCHALRALILRAVENVKQSQKAAVPT